LPYTLEIAGNVEEVSGAHRSLPRASLFPNTPLTLYVDEGLVFTTEVGTLINPSNLRQRSLAPLLKKAGLPHIRFHDLRHTTASLLLAKGVHPKFVQELLGHASIAITLDTYSHAVPGMGDQTAKAMEGALS
jgi:integrase